MPGFKLPPKAERGGPVRKWADPMAASKDRGKWLASAKPAPALEGLDWASMDALCSSESGSGGVLFARLQSGTVVLKGCSTVAQEYVAAELGRELHMPVPRATLVSYPSAEWHALQDAATKILKPEDAPVPDGALLLKASKMLNRPHLLVFEYVQARMLLAAAADADGVRSTREALWDDEGTLLRRLGQLMALDVMLNNWDRVPLIWQHAGNLNNLMVRVAADGDAGRAIHGIDQVAAGITDTEKAAEYVAKVRALCVGVRAATATHGGSVGAQGVPGSAHAQRACAALSQVQGVGFDEEAAARLIDAGLDEGLRKVGTLGEAEGGAHAYFERVWQRCDALCAPDADWGDVWKSSLALVSPVLLGDVVDAVRETYS